MFDTIKNKIILTSPYLVQYIFIERAMKSVKAYTEEANKILFSEKEGCIRERRRHRQLDAIRNACMDMLHLSKADKSVPSPAELDGGNS